AALWPAGGVLWAGGASGPGPVAARRAPKSGSGATTRPPRRSAVRLLQLMLVASVVLPLMLFSFAGWQNYRHEQAVADDRIERSLDILHEHTLKVFQTVERSIAEVNEIV